MRGAEGADGGNGGYLKTIFSDFCLEFLALSLRFRPLCAGVGADAMRAMQLDLQKMQAEKKAQESGAQRQRMEMKSAAAKEAGPTGKKDISGPEEGSKVLKSGCECSWSCTHTTHFSCALKR